MAKASNNEREAALREFGKYLEGELTKHGFTQADLARASELLDKRVVSQMVAGDGERLTVKNCLFWLRGLVLLEIITTEDEAEDWLADFYTAKGIRHGSREYKSLREYQHGEVILALIKRVKRARAIHEDAHKESKYKYWSVQGIPIIGRDQDIDTILDRLYRGERFLTLVGPPGVGKTELALQVADEAKRHGYFLDVNVKILFLEQFRHTEEALGNIAKEIQQLNALPSLLILDNCEQLEGLAEALDSKGIGPTTIANSHPQLSILATSRVIINPLYHPVRPLELPQTKDEPLATLRDYDAIQLFLTSANINGMVLELTEQTAPYIVDICIGLDGFPLALLMASSWLAEHRFTIKGLCDSLLSLGIQEVKYEFHKDSEHGFKDKHISLDQLIQWSYNLLDPQAQTLFQRLAVFPIPRFDKDYYIPTVARFCYWGYDDFTRSKDDVLPYFETLRRHNFITMTDSYVHIAHNTIRDYGRRLIDDSKKTETMRERFVNSAYFFEYTFFITEVFDSAELEDMADAQGFLKRQFKGRSLFININREAQEKKMEAAWRHSFYSVGFLWRTLDFLDRNFWLFLFGQRGVAFYGVPTWAKALKSLIEKYDEKYQTLMGGNEFSGGTACQFQLYQALVEVVETHRKTVNLDGHSILELFHEAFYRACSSRLLRQQEYFYRAYPDFRRSTWDIWDQICNGDPPPSPHHDNWMFGNRIAKLHCLQRGRPSYYHGEKKLEGTKRSWILHP